MKVLFLSPSGTLGGAERVLLQMMGALRRSDPQLALALLSFDDGPLAAEARNLGAQTLVLPLPDRIARMGDSALRSANRAARYVGLLGPGIAAMPAAFAFLHRLRRAIGRSVQPDIVHSNGIKSHLFGALAVPRKIPVVWHIHDMFGARPVAAGLLRRACRGVSAGVAISDAVRRDAEPILKGVPIRTIRNTVDLEKFSPNSAAEMPSALSAPPGALKVGLVATYARWKGHGVFLEAARLAAASQPDPVHFFIIGGPIYRTANQFSLDELRAMAEKFGVADRVAFVPFQHDTAAIYRALDIVVHASTLPEPFGLTIAEAMSCGRAVIVSNAGGASELFTDGHDALGVPPGDSRALADSILRLARDEGLRCELGRNARVSAEKNFNPARLGPELLELYRSVLA